MMIKQGNIPGILYLLHIDDIIMWLIITDYISISHSVTCHWIYIQTGGLILKFLN